MKRYIKTKKEGKQERNRQTKKQRNKERKKADLRKK